MRTITNPTIAALFARNCQYPFIHLVQFQHDRLPETLYFCNDNIDQVSNGQTFTAIKMAPVLPSENTTEMPSGSITVDNDPLGMSRMVLLTMGGAPIKCLVAVINVNEPDTLVVDWITTEIRQPTCDANQMQASLEYEQTSDESIPGDVMGPGDTPGLFTASWYGTAAG